MSFKSTLCADLHRLACHCEAQAGRWTQILIFDRINRIFHDTQSDKAGIHRIISVEFVFGKEAALGRKDSDKMETRRTSPSYNDYARGIKFLNIDEQLTLLEIISTRLKKSIGKRRKKNSIMELEGLGANIWKGIDAQDYVHKERESWD